MKSEQIKIHSLLHGGDYNPDQWLDCPEVLEADVKYMKEAKFNCVSLGIFSWARLELEEGVYDFDWLEQIMNCLYENGIYTILATPTGGMPHWLTEKYEEVRKMSGEGIRRLHGSRHNFCPSSPVMRRKMREMDEALAVKFGDHPGLVAWHISNEYGGDGKEVGCHCPHCEAAFKGWLKERYGTLDQLNHAWWTAFWSNLFTDWEQLHSPSENSEPVMPGIWLDWKRFVSDQMLDFAKEEYASVRKYSSAPIGTNFMEAFQPFDYFKWAKELDYVSWDNYPEWHMSDSEVEPAVNAAFFHTLMRSLKKQPFLLMESAPSVVNWKSRNTLKRPGMHELSSLQAIAHGSNSVQYFQWRKGRGGFEKYHGAVIDHKNGNNTRVFRDVAKVGARLEDISREILSTCNRPRVAMVFDWENWWSIENCAAVVTPFDYLSRIRDYFRVFWEKGIDVDLVNMDDSLEDYSLVVAPANYMYRGKYVDMVKSYIEHGGTYVTTYWSGEVDATDLCFLDSHPLREVLGIRTEEIDVRPESVPNQIKYRDQTYEIKDLCALIHAENAEILAEYQKDFYAGYPALTKNSYGKGTAYYIAAECEIDFIRDFYDALIAETGVGCMLQAKLPEGVTVTERKTEDGGGSVWFVMNFNDHEVEMEFQGDYSDIETGNIVAGKTMLKTYECRILKEADKEKEKN